MVLASETGGRCGFEVRSMICHLAPSVAPRAWWWALLSIALHFPGPCATSLLALAGPVVRFDMQGERRRKRRKKTQACASRDVELGC